MRGWHTARMKTQDGGKAEGREINKWQGLGHESYWKIPISQAEESKSHAWTFNAGGEYGVSQKVCLNFSITWKTQYLQCSLIEMKNRKDLLSQRKHHCLALYCITATYFLMVDKNSKCAGYICGPISSLKEIQRFHSCFCFPSKWGAFVYYFIL